MFVSVLINVLLCKIVQHALIIKVQRRPLHVTLFGRRKWNYVIGAFGTSGICWASQGNHQHRRATAARMKTRGTCALNYPCTRAWWVNHTLSALKRALPYRRFSRRTRRHPFGGALPLPPAVKIPCCVGKPLSCTERN